MFATTILTLFVSTTAMDDKPLAGAVIVVDPGHGGQSYSRSYTGGTTGISSKLTESELNLRVGTELTKLLREAGATVHQIRTGDYRLSREGSSSRDELHARIDYFEHHNPHFFLSVHHNAAAENATGHTTIYKHNAADDTLFEQLATNVNDALMGVLPGPKRKLIKGNYHITRETDIPGTISEAGFMTNKLFDQISNQPDFAKTEAAAIVKGTIAYWGRHRDALTTWRDKLKKERDAKPRDPNTLTATALNPAFQKLMAERLTAISKDGKYAPEKIGDYLAQFKDTYFKDSTATLAITAKYDGKTIRLTGESSDRAYHDQFIDLLVAMKLYSISNTVKLPDRPEGTHTASAPMSEFRLLPYEVLPGPENMAADEVALELAVRGIPTLRFYGWSEPTLSLGYFQPFAVVDENPVYSSIAVVRRSTGGGAIVHHHELTYALGLPSPLVGKEPWGCAMHRIIASALATQTIPSDLIVCGEERKTDPVLCFHHHTAGDLAYGRREKIVGSAQRKQQGAILQHGSILLARSEFAPTLPGIFELTGQRLNPVTLAREIANSFKATMGWNLLPSKWTPDESAKRDELVHQKYGNPEWTRKR